MVVITSIYSSYVSASGDRQPRDVAGGAQLVRVRHSHVSECSHA